MGARWYDSALGRWTSADTIVPEPGNPQSFNRYSYVKNNPLRYVDPSGHIEEDETERALEIIALLDTYNIFIEKDFYWLSDGWQPGAWELSTMEAVLQGVQDFASALGGKDSFKQTLSTGLTFRRESVSWFNAAAGAEAIAPEIRIFDRGVDLNDEAGLKAMVVHELAHTWDQITGGELSKGIENATSSRTLTNGRYVPGGRAANPLVTSAGEDWAYSTEAMVYGVTTNLYDLDNSRSSYIAGKYSGVQWKHDERRHER